MRQIFTIFLLGFFLAAFTGAATTALSQEDLTLPPLDTIEVTAAPGAGATLQDIQIFLNSIKTMRANFVQLSTDGGMAKGTLNLERPGKVRFEYNEDTPILIVSDGTIVNLIDYEIGQVTKWPVEETPLALLLKKDITLGDKVQLSTIPTESGLVTMVSAYDPDRPEQGNLTLYFLGNAGDPDNPLFLDAWEVVDAKGALTRVVLTESETNIPLDETLWTFEDPRNKRFDRRRRR